MGLLDLFDTLLAVGSMFDWITPTRAFLEDSIHVMSGNKIYDFTIASDESIRRVRRSLKNAGIKSWGYVRTFGGDVIVTVSHQNAESAVQLLRKQGFNIKEY